LSKDIIFKIYTDRFINKLSYAKLHYKYNKGMETIRQICLNQVKRYQDNFNQFKKVNSGVIK
jgi:hypothetical protein